MTGWKKIEKYWDICFFFCIIFMLNTFPGFRTHSHFTSWRLRWKTWGCYFFNSALPIFTFHMETQAEILWSSADLISSLAERFRHGQGKRLCPSSLCTVSHWCMNSSFSWRLATLLSTHSTISSEWVLLNKHWMDPFVKHLTDEICFWRVSHCFRNTCVYCNPRVMQQGEFWRIRFSYILNICICAQYRG